MKFVIYVYFQMICEYFSTSVISLEPNEWQRINLLIFHPETLPEIKANIAIWKKKFSVMVNTK